MQFEYDEYNTVDFHCLNIIAIMLLMYNDLDLFI